MSVGGDRRPAALGAAVVQHGPRGDGVEHRPPARFASAPSASGLTALRHPLRWQEVSEACDLAVGEAGECVGRPLLRVDAVELGSLDPGAGNGRGAAARCGSAPSSTSDGIGRTSMADDRPVPGRRRDAQGARCRADRQHHDPHRAADGQRHGPKRHAIERAGQRLKPIRTGFAAACRRAGIEGGSIPTLRHTAAVHWRRDPRGRARPAPLDPVDHLSKAAEVPELSSRPNSRNPDARRRCHPGTLKTLVGDERLELPTSSV
jgi:hypothetical protein